MPQELLALYSSLRTKSDTYTKEVASLFKSGLGEYPAGLFGLIFNYLTLSLELLSYYDAHWRTVPTPVTSSPEQALKEKKQRIFLIQKMAFVLILSSVEVVFKDYIKRFPNKIGACENRYGQVHLSKIIKNSKDIISSPTAELWDGVITLRNSLVHNNGISEISKTYQYPKHVLELNAGKMTYGNIIDLTYLIEWVLDASKAWTEAIHKK